jgi:hypothetical protein
MGGNGKQLEWEWVRPPIPIPIPIPFSFELFAKYPENPRPEMYRVAEEIFARDLIIPEKVTDAPVALPIIAGSARGH